MLCPSCFYKEYKYIFVDKFVTFRQAQNLCLAMGNGFRLATNLDDKTLKVFHTCCRKQAHYWIGLERVPTCPSTTNFYHWLGDHRQSCMSSLPLRITTKPITNNCQGVTINPSILDKTPSRGFANDCTNTRRYICQRSLLPKNTSFTEMMDTSLFEDKATLSAGSSSVGVNVPAIVGGVAAFFLVALLLLLLVFFRKKITILRKKHLANKTTSTTKLDLTNDRWRQSNGRSDSSNSRKVYYVNDPHNSHLNIDASTDVNINTRHLQPDPAARYRNDAAIDYLHESPLDFEQIPEYENLPESRPTYDVPTDATYDDVYEPVPRENYAFMAPLRS